MSSEEATGTAAAATSFAATVKTEEQRITPRTSLLQGESIRDGQTPHAMVRLFLSDHPEHY